MGETEEFVQEFLARVPNNPFLKAGYAHILVDTDRREGAARLFDEIAATGFTHPTHNTAWLWFFTESAWVCSRLHRPDCVAPIRSALEPYADQLVVGGFGGFVGGPVAFYLGILATTAGDWPAAAAHFTAATDTLERIGARPWLARTRVEHARMLLARAEPGDGEQAPELIGLALATARELGLTKIEQDATDLRHTICSRRPSRRLEN